MSLSDMWFRVTHYLLKIKITRLRENNIRFKRKLFRVLLPLVGGTPDKTYICSNSSNSIIIHR